MHQTVIALCAAFVITLSTSAHATGRYACEATDPASWRTPAQLDEKMLADGWEVRKSKEDGGCYEAYGTTPESQQVEAYFHPVTLEKLLVARRGEILFKKGD